MPVTSDEVAKVFVASATNPNPVIKLAAAGLTPMSPTMAVVPVVEMPVFAKATKFPADPRPTGTRPAAADTIRVAEPDFPPDVAVISVDPAVSAVATPELDTTVATAGVADAHDATELTLTMEPSE